MRSLAALLIPIVISMAAPVFAQAPADLVVIDLRPKEEREGFKLSELAGKCNKDVYRIPDVASDPLKVEVLKSDLMQQLPDFGAGKTLTVLNWSIYYNKQVQGGGGGLRGLGVGGISIPTGKKSEKRAGSDCSREESAGGWYEAGEISSTFFPLVSEFEGTYGGKPVSVRIVHSPRRKLAGKFDGNPDDTDNLLETVRKTAEAVAYAIVQ
jgi:hypothetical protein